MDLTLVNASDLVPPVPSEPDRYLPPHLWEPWNELSSRREPRLLTASWFWSQALLSAAAERSSLRSFPGYRFTLAGFLDPRHEGGGFGLIVQTQPDARLRPDPSFNFRRAGSRNPRTSESVTIGDRSFRVVVRAVEERPHQLPNPVKGTSACWATSRVGSDNEQHGLLTVKHLTDGMLGGLVDLDNGGVAVVSDLGPDGIDAAIVTPLEDRPDLDAPRLLYQPYVAPWTPVTIRGSRRTTSTRITAVGDVFGVEGYPQLPVRLATAMAGVPGDSGALVVDDEGRACGLYMGEYSNVAGQVGGVCQSISQVVKIMELELGHA